MAAGAVWGLLKGFDRAVGANESANDVQAKQDQAKADKANKVQMQLAPLHLASVALQSQLAPLIDPETGKPRPGQEARYNEVHDQLADVIGKQRVLLNPPPKEDPHGLGYLIHAATDKAHITNHAVQQAKDAQAKKVADYKKQGQDEVTETVQGVQPSFLTTSEMAQRERIKAGLEAKEGSTKETSDTRARADFAADPDKKTGETFESWKVRKGVEARNAPKGLKYDSATGQAIDQATGKRYNPNDPNNPSEVNAMILGAAQMAQKKEALQVRLAGMRGATYNATKPMVVLDSANGNSPTVTTFGDMQKQPGRYVPAGEADKAIAKENLMQDIAGTSQITRKAITNMKDDFPEAAKIKIAAAMRADDPHASLDQLIASSALGSLTAEQQDFLIATRQLAENAMAMRSILGAGQGSQDVRSAVRDTLPGLLSPDKSYALRQLNAFDATINRLHRGVPNIKLNEIPMAPQGPKTQSLTAPKGAVGKITYQGKKYWVDKDKNNLGEVK
jgi:hypothetical protein